MVVKERTYYSCQNCGYQSLKWMGRCPDCGKWGTLVEEKTFESSLPRRDWEEIGGEKEVPQPLTTIEFQEEKRIKTNLNELDRVLGGGIVSGSVILIGGDPGIGKSTLLLQALNQLGLAGRKTLYISGEESSYQTKIRGERLGVSTPNLYTLAETSLERILEEVKKLKPQVLVIDSIQTIFTSALPSSPGSVSQVRESSAKLIFLSKRTGIPLFLIGHVTKEGAIAGPKLLEHMVDTVLYFEGDQGHPYRILRAVKNRYGSTNEIGVFEMKDKGLEEVLSPSELFLAERPLGASGSVVVSSLEGSRPILVELQALVSSSSFGVPRRTTMGVDYNRVSLLIAVLEKKVGLNLFNQDVFLNVAGGLKVEEPAIDLGIVVSIASSFWDKPIDPQTVVFGEVGLAGEVRGINQGEVRVKEALKLGFNRFILPQNNQRRIKEEKVELVGVDSVKEALRVLFGAGRKGKA